VPYLTMLSWHSPGGTDVNNGKVHSTVQPNRDSNRVFKDIHGGTATPTFSVRSVQVAFVRP
jgi:hypothetical protein